MLMARLGSTAMVARARARRVELPFWDAGRKRLGNRGFGRAGCWPRKWKVCR
jgi:hypothetical protein